MFKRETQELLVDKRLNTCTTHLEEVSTLQHQITETLRPLLNNGKKVALLDFPNHPNVGDSAIWLGELSCLRTLGIRRIEYQCDHTTYSRDSLKQRIGDGLILLHGGGNLGDLWEEMELFRERVLTDFPNNRIIQLPQTVFFKNRRALARARTIFNEHHGLTILVRDHRSLDIVKNEFQAPSILCPDMAFSLGPLKCPSPTTNDIIWLSRADREAREDSINRNAKTGVQRVDWVEDDVSIPGVISRHLIQQLILHPKKLRFIANLPVRFFHRLAHERVNRGLRLLSRGSGVITDRLHGHILCLLLGIPHLLVDDKYGKVRQFYETWTHKCRLARYCESYAEVISIATKEFRNQTMKN